MALRAELFVVDLDASAQFYTDVLGFFLDHCDEGYRSLHRDGVVLGLSAVADLPAQAGAGFTQNAVRSSHGTGIELVLELADGPDEVDAVYEQARRAGASIAAAPQDRPWGLRDFRLTDPDGYYLRVTHAVRSGDKAPLAPAATPQPPYTAVIFTSVRTAADETGYAETAAAMERLAAEQPGYLGIESARDGLGITVSYWADPADAQAWKAVAEHRLAQRLGREQWYQAYRVRVATVERDYGLG
jgi:heme-degrading monooxygenase HmoA/uncharacterized glyoxalase superfamily protein PhnB